MGWDIVKNPEGKYILKKVVEGVDKWANEIAPKAWSKLQNVPSSAIRGVQEEIAKPLTTDVMGTYFRPVTGAIKGIQKGLKDDNYYAGKALYDKLIAEGKSPDEAMGRSMALEMLIPGIGVKEMMMAGNLIDTSKATNSVSDTYKLTNAWKVAKGADADALLDQVKSGTLKLDKNSGMVYDEIPISKGTTRQNVGRLPMTKGKVNTKAIDKGYPSYDVKLNNGKPLVTKAVANDYVFHTTSPNNLEGISKNGLKPSAGVFGRGVYFAPTIEQTGGYGSSEGALLRINKTQLPKSYQEFSDQGWTNDVVKPDKLDVSLDAGKTWKPLLTKAVDNTAASKLAKNFKVTKKMDSFGYLLPNGKVADISGVGDHTQMMSRAGVNSNDFTNEGIIRYNGEKPREVNVTLFSKPTQEQLEALKNANTKTGFPKRYFYDFSENGEIAKSSPIGGSTYQGFIDDVNKFYTKAVDNIDPLKYKSAGEFVNKHKPISQFTDEGKTGEFWTTPEGADSGYGTIKKDAFIDINSSKIYKGQSSLDYIKEKGLLTKDIQNKIENAWTTSDPSMEFKIPQDIARKQLQEEGYSGAYWKYEDDLNPTQYQVWDKSIIKTKSQLTDIWNKANQSFDLTTELKKYKNYDDFKKNNIIEIPIDKTKRLGGVAQETTDPFSWDKTTGTKSTNPIRIKYTTEDGYTTLIDGNTRLRQAIERGDRSIKAHIEFWRDDFGQNFWNKANNKYNVKFNNGKPVISK